VVTGGHYDVDVVLTDPLKNVLYKEERQHNVIDVIGQEKLFIFICKMDRHYAGIVVRIFGFKDS
jgi:hypothetical protein